jgi:putative selenium metabolism hydrolase
MDSSQLIQFTQDIVRIPSLSGQEEAVAKRVESEMRSLAFDRVWTDGNGSVVGVVEGARDGKTILLDAHTDTVGISPGVPWQHEPFGAQIDGGKIFGRGVADMKGALAAMVHAAASLDRLRLAGRVVVTASTLEEVLEGVALQAIMEHVQPDFVVIGESTNLQLARGGRGRAEVRLTTTGRPAHSSSPQLGHNAVLDMMKVIAAVESLSLSSESFMGPAILALTDIISDPYPGHSVIPSMCRATYDRRLLPGETPATVLDVIRQDAALQGINLRVEIGTGHYAAYTGTILVCDKFFPAWHYAEDDPFVTTALSGLHAAGIGATTSAYRFCTNAAYSAGIAHVPTIGFGPATEADAHVIDECLSIADLQTAARGYQAIIEAVLGA